MANNIFTNIGLFTKSEGIAIKESLKDLIAFLQSRNQHNILFETNTATLINITAQHQIFPLEVLAERCDLMIVVGGDGSLLTAGRAIVDHDIPILGINHGSLGFMTDINPEQLQTQLPSILDGEYIEDERCLLHVEIIRDGKTFFASKAINDVILYNGEMVKLMEFEIFIDKQFVMHQRSDGIITATPTGSTAYALSAGGPILYPALHAFSLIPLYPHTLTSRPIIVQDTSIICYLLPNKKNIQHKLACDGHMRNILAPNDEIFIKKYSHPLKVIHPTTHNYFALLRNKLGWSTYVGSDRFQQHATQP